MIIGFGRVGRLVAEMLADARPALCRGRFEHRRGQGGAAPRASRSSSATPRGPNSLDKLNLGHASALILTMDDPVQVVRLVKRVRGWCPDLTIVARARDPEHAAELYRAGATDAVPETLESSLQLSEAVLVDLGMAMGPVIASIHEKRAELRQQIMEKGETGRAEPAAAAAKQAARTMLKPRSRLRARAAFARPRAERVAPPCRRPGRRPGPCRDGRRRPARRRASTALRTRSTALRAAGQIVGDADRDGGAAVVDRDEATTPEPTRCLASSTRPRSSLGSMPSSTWPMKPWPPTCSGPAASALPPPPSASAFFASASSRSSRRRSSTSAATRAGTSSGEALSAAAASLSRSSRSVSQSRAASPVSASIRRTPEATALSRGDLEQLDVAERADMGAAAQLDRIARLVLVAHREDADLVAIFLAEQRHRAGRDRLVHAHQPDADRLVLADMAVHVGLDRLDLLAGHRLGVREIEAEIVGRDQAALLRDMVAEPLAQRRVEQMGGAVIGADLGRGARHRRASWTASPTVTAPAFDHRVMGVQLAERLRRVLNIGLASLCPS